MAETYVDLDMKGKDILNVGNIDVDVFTTSTVTAVNVNSTNGTFVNLTVSSFADITNLSVDRLTASIGISTSDLTASDIQFTNLTGSYGYINDLTSPTGSITTLDNTTLNGTNADFAKLTSTSIISDYITNSFNISTDTLSASDAINCYSLTASTKITTPDIDLVSINYTTSSIETLLEVNNTSGSYSGHSGEIMRGQEFIPTTTGELTAVEFAISQITGSYGVEIRRGGVNGIKVVSTSAAITTTSTWTGKITMPTTTLIAGETYGLVINEPTESGSGMCNFSNNTYASGAGYYFDDATLGWIGYNDISFRIWGNPYSITCSENFHAKNNVIIDGSLDVAGSINSTPKTRYLSIPAASFIAYRPDINSFAYNHIGATSLADDQILVASIQLPDEASIKGCIVYGNVNATWALKFYNIASIEGTIASANVGSSDTCDQRVSNTDTFYTINVSNLDNAYGVDGAVVTYEL